MRPLLEILESISAVSFVAAFCLNLLLLYLIRRFSTKELGTYKYLLEVFAAYNTYLVVIHHITNPKTIPSPTGFAFVSDRDYGTFALTVNYSAVYDVPFVILNIHLLFRYWTISAPHRIALFSNTKFVVLLVIFTVFSYMLMLYLSAVLARPEDDEEIRHYQRLFCREYDRDHVNEGVFVLNYWACHFREDKLSIRPFTMLVTADIMQFASSSLAATLATLTYRAIREAKHISETIRNFHLRILLAASAQTLTPVIFVYIPFFLNVNISLLHIYSPNISALGMVLFSCFPCIDAVVMIVLMKPYRDGLLRLLRIRAKPKERMIKPAFTTAVSVSAIRNS